MSEDTQQALLLALVIVFVIGSCAGSQMYRDHEKYKCIAIKSAKECE